MTSRWSHEQQKNMGEIQWCSFIEYENPLFDHSFGYLLAAITQYRACNKEDFDKLNINKWKRRCLLFKKQPTLWDDTRCACEQPRKKSHRESVLSRYWHRNDDILKKLNRLKRKNIHNNEAKQAAFWINRYDFKLASINLERHGKEEEENPTRNFSFWNVISV